MEWFPVGPDFVFDPIDRAFTRLTPSNEGGVNGRVVAIALQPSSDPLRPDILYAIGGEGRWRDGLSTSVFRKAAGDAAWSCPGDALLAAHPLADPSCVAVHPTVPDHAYVGTWGDRGVYLYDGTAGAWSAKSPLPGRVRSILVDPRPVTTIDQTILYAATDVGIYRSETNGGSWTQVLAGNCWSLAADIPAVGSPRFYAGLEYSGVWFADTEPLAPADWTNLAIAPSGFRVALVDFCPANPDCAYAWFAHDSGGDAVYSTLDPRVSWTLRNSSVSALDPGTSTPYLLRQWQTFQCLSFAVAPDSPGDGASDVLFFGSLFYARSADSGTSWTIFRDFFHVDVRALAFAPGSPAAFYLGCDGGIAVYSNATQAGFDPNLTIVTDDRSSRDAVSPLTKTFRSASRGLANCCTYALAQDPAGMTQLYTGCVDSGIAVKNGGLGWRSLSGGDAFKVAVARAPDGVRVRQELFGGIGVGGKLSLGTHSDAGGGVSGAAYPVGDPGGSVISTSNYVIDGAGNCYAGGFLSSAVTQTTSLVAAASGMAITVPVTSTAGITEGSSIAFANHPRQHYQVSNVTPTSFDIGVLYWDAPAATQVRLLQLCAFRNALDLTTARISQFFTPNTIHNSVTAFARGGGNLACATFDTVSSTANLWLVDETSTLGGPATWTAVPLPAGAPAVVGLVLGVTGDAYVLFANPLADPGSGIVSPLYRVAAGTTTLAAETCTSLPTPLLPDGSAARFGILVADPLRSALLWAVAGGEVYRLDLDTSGGTRTWDWQPAGAGLPGPSVTDLAFVDLTPAGGPPKLVLRAATNGRSVWELDTSDGAEPLASDLYLRRHLLDDGWTDELRDALPHPLRPGEHVWHWQCIDIKIDRPVTVGSGQSYFQTDPDASGTTYSDLTVPPGPIPPATIPFSHDQFDMLNDFGEAVPAGNRVRVHVQLQNRASTAAGGVSVWALWTHPSGLLPALNLNDDLSTFDFWSQFHGDGSIVDALPSNSRWKAVGAPIVLDDIAASRPQVASWNWDAPSSAGHYCIAVFVHALASPIGEGASFSVDEIVGRNKQVGQKNLQVIDITGGTTGYTMAIDINNPLADPTGTDLHVDGSLLPKGVSVGVRLSRVRLPRSSLLALVRQQSFWSLRRWIDLLLVLLGFDLSRKTHRVPPEKELVIAQIPLRAHELIRAHVRVKADADSVGVDRARLLLRQVVHERLTGGSTIELRFHGKKQESPPPVPSSKVPDADAYRHEQELQQAR